MASAAHVRVFLTNDDGIGAKGLEVLKAIALRLSDDVWIVAPEVEQSNSGRALTTNDPIRVRQLADKTFAVSGTPTDCVMVGLRELVEGPTPDLILSGVNRGRNIADDITVSGTVAGAIEGMALGVPSVALSQAMRRVDDQMFVPWETAAAYGESVVRQVLEVGWPSDVILNVNFPAVSPQEVLGLMVTRQGLWGSHGRRTERRTDLRGRPYYWVGDNPRTMAGAQGTDIDAVSTGRISITPLHIDLTHHQCLADLRRHFETNRSASASGSRRRTTRSETATTPSATS